MAETVAPQSTRFGWRAERRPQPVFVNVLGAAAGAFAVVAIVAFVGEVTDTDPTAPGVGFNLGLAALALAAGYFLRGPVRSAGVTALIFTVPLIWYFAFFGGGSFGRGEQRGVLLLTLASYLVLYLFSWTRGRAVFLAGALLFFSLWVVFEVGSQNSPVPFQSQISSGTSATVPGFPSSSFDNSDDKTDETSGAALAVGVVLIAFGTVLDRKKLAGAATPFVAVGAIDVIIGAVVLGGNHSTLAGGLAAAGAGALVGLVGARGEGRRGTTWIGVLTVFGGLVAVMVDINPDSAGQVGLIALAFAMGLIAIALVLAPILGEPDEDDDVRRPKPEEPAARWSPRPRRPGPSNLPRCLPAARAPVT